MRICWIEKNISSKQTEILKEENEIKLKKKVLVAFYKKVI